ncbi:hypothetical protein [Aeromonas hydrophila]|uniref:hypothetical protein n=1 Tax=Aeromonas hydrophila TaxID=644 RepID=UPI001890AF80|nr:hypothetical protein [Aeromonas hydrophila]MBF4801575.1 hypothetical protein [Aeromonas hydrophila]
MSIAFGPLRGFVVGTVINDTGPIGTIADISGVDYFITPQNWLGEAPPEVGMIVEFNARAVQKGFLAVNIKPINASTLCTPGMSATKLEMIEADRRAERARQHITRLRQLVFDMGYSPEKAILEVFDITPPTGIVIPDGPSDRDLQFMELLTHNRSPKDKHETSRRLCQAFCLSFSALIGFMRGSITYRVALERAERDRQERSRRHSPNSEQGHPISQEEQHEPGMLKKLVTNIMGNK